MPALRDAGGGDEGGSTPLARELAAFPEVLRNLIEAELAAGNSIVEVGHTHPAPPAGGYVLLERKVTTRARASGDGLDFYERQGAAYSGEFTDARRFHFVLEPPNPPPPEPDMDAIRRALEPRSTPLTRLAEREAGTGALGEAPIPAETLISTATATSRHHELHFRDARTPDLIRVALERTMMVPFTGDLTDGALRFTAHANVNGARYEVVLHFVAALERENRYRFVAEVSWAEHAEVHHEYFRTTSASWLQLWTRDFTPATPARAGEGLPNRYRALAEQAIRAEAGLDSVAAVQAAIVDGLKRGGRYATSHKEGGSTISWRAGRFMREDYGDDPDTVIYRDEAHFLEMLGHFCRIEVTRHAGSESPSGLDTWKLILRRMIEP